MTNDNKDVENTLRQIRILVYQNSPAYIDQESLVHDIWLECELKGLVPFPKLVRHRCIDASRAYKIRVKREKVLASSRKCFCDHSLYELEKEFISIIIDQANLEPIEKQVIFLYFYAKHKLADIALLLDTTQHNIEQIKASALLKLKRAASFLERKESSE